MESTIYRVNRFKGNNSNMSVEKINAYKPVGDTSLYVFNVITPLYLLLVGISGIFLNTVALSRLITATKVCNVNNSKVIMKS